MKKISTKTLVTGAAMTALILLLQMVVPPIRFGPFSVSFVLVPLVIGACVCGPAIGTWLGFVFGMAVLLSGDAAAFLAVDPAATVAIVLVKGMLAGLASGYVYRVIRLSAREKEWSRWVGGIAAAIVCPVVNTGVFLLGAYFFMWDLLAQWAQGMGFGDNVIGYMFLGLVGGNFLFELGVNMALSPAIVRLIRLSGSGREKRRQDPEAKQENENVLAESKDEQGENDDPRT